MKYALYLSMLFVLSATAQTKDDGPTMAGVRGIPTA